MKKKVLTSRAIVRILKNADPDEVAEALEQLDLISESTSEDEVQDSLENFVDLVLFALSFIPHPLVKAFTLLLSALFDAYISSDKGSSIDVIDLVDLSAFEDTEKDDRIEELETEIESLKLALEGYETVLDEIEILKPENERLKREIGELNSLVNKLSIELEAAKAAGNVDIPLLVRVHDAVHSVVFTESGISGVNREILRGADVELANYISRVGGPALG